MKRLFDLHEGRYGSPRITDDLRDDGWRVSENTVAALMRELHLAARSKRKRRSTTRPGRGRWRVVDLVKRDFLASAINHTWYGDGTEIPTDEGKLHLASVMDMASRRVLGFALSEHHNTPARLRGAGDGGGGPRWCRARGHLPHRPALGMRSPLTYEQALAAGEAA